MTPTILIVEDGDEYLDNLSRFVAGPRYLQSHDGHEALIALQRERVDLVYLDMRFDRIAEERLLGSGSAAVRSLSHLQNNQGLYILQAIADAGHRALPVILAYDFSEEAARFEHLAARHENLTWVPDAVTPDEIRARIGRLTGAVW